ncbi:coiled-coil domain-containing protein [Tripterygium wilfordii]|uniref:Coiled-coil domain-containing protein n=1 Tax=Tripterygium wilfordii TaxID=458696 RepID=A0A7J7CZN3_TRIWF|nr:coiled-coil domain-containing protein [Tripterygium wilfordii]
MNSIMEEPKQQQTEIRTLSLRLFQAEEQLKQMKSRRKEDSKANARVVEIFASHRNAWQSEERRLLEQIDSLQAKVNELEGGRQEVMVRIQDLQRELDERDEMIGFMSRSRSGECHEEEEDEEGRLSGCGSADCCGREQVVEEKENFAYGQEQQQHLLVRGNEFGSGFMASASKFWAETACPWQDVQYESLESLYHPKHFVAREFPWKVDGESTGVSIKLKLLEQQLLNMEIIGKSDLSKVPSLMRKQAKRYQALAGKIGDLCTRMQASDPSEPTLNPEFRTQRQTEFLLEAFRLQQRASETGQKLLALQSDIGQNYYGYEPEIQVQLTTRRSLDSIRYNLKEVQRNLEIWLARIIGDLEGILSRDGASREYYISTFSSVQ